MELTPLLTSVENWGVPGHFLEKIFWGLLADGLMPEIKSPYLYMHGMWGVRDMFLEKYFWGAGGCSENMLPRAC